MGFFKRYKIKKILLTFLWLILAGGSTFLLVAAVKKSDMKKCTGVNIRISGVNDHYFIDKKDVEQIITSFKHQKSFTRINNYDLNKMEQILKRDIWIKDAEMFFDNNGVLQVDIEEREPLARIFSVGGTSFYIDSSLMMLPLSEKFSARLPIFTGFPSEARVLKPADSLLLREISQISQAIQADPFLMGMIEQVDITTAKTFELIPKIGNQLIVIGDGNDINEKFRKLKLFYSNVVMKTGWQKYSVISLQFKGQVVGKIRGQDDVTADSLRTLQLMAIIAANAEKMAADSARTFQQDTDKNNSDSTMVQQSIQRDEPGQPDETADKNEVKKEVIRVESLAPVKMKEIKKVTLPANKKTPVQKKPEPQAVMKKENKNEYR